MQVDEVQSPKACDVGPPGGGGGVLTCYCLAGLHLSFLSFACMRGLFFSPWCMHVQFLCTCCMQALCLSRCSQLLRVILTILPCRSTHSSSQGQSTSRSLQGTGDVLSMSSATDRHAYYPAVFFVGTKQLPTSLQARRAQLSSRVLPRLGSTQLLQLLPSVWKVDSAGCFVSSHIEANSGRLLRFYCIGSQCLVDLCFFTASKRHQTLLRMLPVSCKNSLWHICSPCSEMCEFYPSAPSR